MSVLVFLAALAVAGPALWRLRRELVALGPTRIGRGRPALSSGGAPSPSRGLASPGAASALSPALRPSPDAPRLMRPALKDWLRGTILMVTGGTVFGAVTGGPVVAVWIGLSVLFGAVGVALPAVLVAGGLATAAARGIARIEEAVIVRTRERSVEAGHLSALPERAASGTLSPSDDERG